MACGTGKTLVGLWVTEELASQRTLVLLPSLSLLAQTLREWTANATRPFAFLPVCSDETVREADRFVSDTSELGFPVTTDPAEIAAFLAAAGPRVVFSTYQSSPRIAAALKRSDVSFDLAIADEAHRCAGPASSDFAVILDSGLIRSERRLFQTATPRYFTERVRKIAGEGEYEIVSMDDEALFGPEFHRLSFGEAIQRELLSDYQVLVFGIDNPTYREYVERGTLVTRDGREVIGARYLASQIALAKAMREHNLRRTISFHGRVSRAREFGTDFPEVVAWMPEADRPSGTVWADHVDGEMPSGQRDKRLKRLREVTQSERGLLTNARCLGEGVDVPTLDGVAFIDPRSSQVDIIQAVGRAIRKAEDKTLGTVVIPVFLERADEADDAIASSAFRPVWEVLRALRAHDAELADEIDEMRRSLGKLIPRGSRKIILKGFGAESVDLPSRVGSEFAAAFWLAAALRVGEKPSLSIPQVLQWADSHRARTGEWPTVKSGPIEEWPGDSWKNVNNALMLGLRGLPGGSSLAALLVEERGLRNRSYLPDLTIGQVLDWADAHRVRTGNWPEAASGPIVEAAGETWTGIQGCLLRGRRGLPGGSSLKRLLAEHRGTRYSRAMPLSVAGILAWADAHHGRTGEWPGKDSGGIAGTLGETWGRVNKALMDGIRGLPGGSSLARLLAEHRNVRNARDLPDLDVATILSWADAHHRRTGKWPKGNSGPIREAPGESWTGVTVALYQGLRGLPGGSSLAQLLDQHRRVRNIKGLSPLTVETIMAWADNYHASNGRWPTNKSGAIQDVTGETWMTVDKALRRGRRGLRSGSSLARLLDEHRRKRAGDRRTR